MPQIAEVARVAHTQLSKTSSTHAVWIESLKAQGDFKEYSGVRCVFIYYTLKLDRLGCVSDSTRHYHLYRRKYTTKAAVVTNDNTAVDQPRPSLLHNVRSRNTQPHLKVGLGISRTNADSHWNPLYNEFLLWKRNDSSVLLFTWS